jgi:hypothetical protein
MTKATELAYPFNSFIVVDGYSELLSMPSQNRSEGMHAYAIDTDKIYVLQSNLIFWEISTLITSLDGYISESDQRLVPSGGDDGYVLRKASADDFDVEWVPTTSLIAGNGVPSGGTTGQILLKASASNFDTVWEDVTSSGLSLSELDLILDGYISLQMSDGYATKQLNNLQNTAINADIIPLSDGTVDIGNQSNRWQRIYAANLYGNMDDGVIQ